MPGPAMGSKGGIPIEASDLEVELFAILVIASGLITVGGLVWYTFMPTRWSRAHFMMREGSVGDDGGPITTRANEPTQYPAAGMRSV
jgi:hypothetical protein